MKRAVTISNMVISRQYQQTLADIFFQVATMSRVISADKARAEQTADPERLSQNLGSGD